MLQRKCDCGQHTIGGGGCAECEKKKGALQRKASNTEPANDVPPIVHQVLGSPGQPLDAATRAFMEPRFGHDFSSVLPRTIHSGVIQTKLVVSQAADKYEQEADRIATMVLMLPNSPTNPHSLPAISNYLPIQRAPLPHDDDGPVLDETDLSSAEEADPELLMETGDLDDHSSGQSCVSPHSEDQEELVLERMTIPIMAKTSSTQRTRVAPEVEGRLAADHSAGFSMPQNLQRDMSWRFGRISQRSDCIPMG